jgi:hypothetical protein
VGCPQPARAPSASSVRMPATRNPRKRLLFLSIAQYLREIIKRIDCYQRAVVPSSYYSMLSASRVLAPVNARMLWYGYLRRCPFRAQRRSLPCPMKRLPARLRP